MVKLMAENIEYDAHCSLNGIAPSTDTYVRGGKVAEGTISEMVKQGVALIEKGYGGVMILTANETYDAAKITEIFARIDFPKK